MAEIIILVKTLSVLILMRSHWLDRYYQINKYACSMPTKKSVYVFFFFLSVLSCNKGTDNNSLPPATQNGSNTMGAKINGIVWSRFPCIDCIGGGSGLTASFNDGFLHIVGDSINSSKIIVEIELDAVNVTGTGVYDLGIKGSNNITNHGEVNYYNHDNTVNYFTDLANKGTITITKLDMTKHIVSGTFAFNAVNQSNATDVKIVSQGRFDIPFIPN